MGDSVFLQKSVNGDSGTCLGVHLLDGSGVAAAACDARRAAVGENSKRCELVVPEGPASQASPSPSPLRSPSMCASPTPLRTLCPPLWREGCVHVVSRHDLSSARGGIWRENRTHPHREGERGPSLFPSKNPPVGRGQKLDELCSRTGGRTDTGPVELEVGYRYLPRTKEGARAGDPLVLVAEGGISRHHPIGAKKEKRRRKVHNIHKEPEETARRLVPNAEKRFGRQWRMVEFGKVG